MRVACYFSGKTKLGGAERRLTRIFDILSVEGEIEVTFVLRSYENPSAVVSVYNSFSNKGHIKYHFVKDSNWELFSYVLKEKFDAVFFIGPYRAMMPFAIAGKLSEAKCIWLLVNTSLSSYVFDNVGQKVLFKICEKISDRIDCLFPDSVHVLEKYIKKRDKLSVTPCAFTNLDEFRSVKKENTIVFLSRLVKGKNVELFIDAVVLAQKKLVESNYKIIIAGDGELKSYIEERVRNERLEDIVVLPGYVDSRNYFPQAEVFMSLQNINNYPSQSLLEAIACGCYIIATNVGDTDTIVKPDFGVLCEYDANEIAQLMIEYIMKNDQEKKKIQEKARVFAEKTFVVENSVKHYRRMLLDNGR